MRKTLMGFVVVACVLGLVQFNQGGGQRLEASKLPALGEYFVGNGFNLDLKAADSGGKALPSETSEPAPKLIEPATLMLFGLGLLGVSLFKRRLK